MVGQQRCSQRSAHALGGDGRDEERNPFGHLLVSDKVRDKFTLLSFRMLLTRAVRPDRLIIAAKHFVQSVFGDGFVQKAEALLHLEDIINNEVGDDDRKS